MPWKRTGYSSRKRKNASWFSNATNPAKKQKPDDDLDSNSEEQYQEEDPIEESVSGVDSL